MTYKLLKEEFLLNRFCKKLWIVNPNCDINYQCQEFLKIAFSGFRSGIPFIPFSKIR